MRSKWMVLPVTALLAMLGACVRTDAPSDKRVCIIQAVVVREGESANGIEYHVNIELDVPVRAGQYVFKNPYRAVLIDVNSESPGVIRQIQDGYVSWPMVGADNVNFYECDSVCRISYVLPVLFRKINNTVLIGDPDAVNSHGYIVDISSSATVGIDASACIGSSKDGKISSIEWVSHKSISALKLNVALMNFGSDVTMTTTLPPDDR